MATAEGARDKALLAVVYNCGLRRGEVRFLSRDDYVRRRGMGSLLKVKRLKKGGLMEFEIPLWARTSRLLDKYLAGRRDSMDPLFLTRVGTPMSGQMVYYIYRDAARLAGIPLDRRHPHAMRHSIGTHLKNAGIPIDEIKEHLGHDSIESTLVYARVIDPVKTRSSLLTEASHHVARF